VKTLGAIAALALVTTAPALASAKNAPARRERAVSVGSPSDGKLVGGKKISASPTMRLVGEHPWGLPDLVDMLTRSADRVAKKHPGAVLTVADLSKKGGGDVDGHRSHESGRDADVGFYMSKGGKSFLAPRFAAIEEDGRARGLPGVRFDDAKNWALVEAWLTDPSTNVLMIFAAKHIEDRLLAFAAASGAPAALRARAAEVLIQPHGALPHDNHFHVRITCPRGQADCQNFAPHKIAARPKPTRAAQRADATADRRPIPKTKKRR
jgi:penicillin-insensitive murein endopeptidase